MYVIEERVNLVEDRIDNLDAIFGRFMAQTDMLMRSMARQTREYRHEAKEGRQEQARQWEQYRQEAEKDRQKAKEGRQEQVQQWEQYRQEAEKDRQQAKESRQEQARQWVQYRQERAQQWEQYRQEAKEGRQEQARQWVQYRQERAQQWEQYCQQSYREHRKLARQLGEIANRQGRLVEDIITPSIRRLARDELGCGELQFFAGRVKKRHVITGQPREFDALYIGAKAILLNESKATVRPEYAKKFVEFLQTAEFWQYFPEYAGMPLVPVFSSLDIPENVLKYLTRHKAYAVGMGDDTMVVLNLEQVAGGDGRTT